MSIFDKPVDSKPRENPPEGKYDAVLMGVVDLGTHEDTYQGVSRTKHELQLTWELCGSQMSDGRPFVVSKNYTCTNGQFGMYFAATSNIFKMLKTWTGKDEKACKKPGILGQLIRDQTPATITIEHQQGKTDPTKTYANIESIKPFKGKNPPTRTNAPVVYELGGPGLEELPEWQRKKIAECLENTTGLPERKKDDVDHGTTEDIPF